MMDEKSKSQLDIEKLSAAFAKSTTQAEETVKDKKKTSEVLEEAMEKAENLQGPLEKVWDKLILMFGVVKDWLKGDYKEFPIGSIVAIIASLLYLICPIDIIPDFIPVVGYIDDVFVIGLVFAQVYSDLEKYREWKIKRDQEEANSSSTQMP